MSSPPTQRAILKLNDKDAKVNISGNLKATITCIHIHYFQGKKRQRKEIIRTIAKFEQAIEHSKQRQDLEDSSDEEELRANYTLRDSLLDRIMAAQATRQPPSSP